MPCNRNTSERIGSDNPKLVLYLPHKPQAYAQLQKDADAGVLLEQNSNHWRKIVTLLAKIASPVETDWRHFRDTALFAETAICFTPELIGGTSWHWIGGKDNLHRFEHLVHRARPFADCDTVLIDPETCLLITPYPDYRQLTNAMVGAIRSELSRLSFYRT
ncbi:hypothetical protein PVT68_03310 [Microbulbifer bruguierae]|uniref:Uncharacterized protein n=1 Tax=Microbulbifer bruguierae TaxID=3029061 RepID=A0ABY8NH00_9GAMM|nr:hypothetical protein [Microbulbifer bruguierae]WGL17332.1 hypothetical protein PVT68_03310 [Microbulbifer bruguierae]